MEGQITNEPIVLVDDVLNSGKSLEKARAVLAREGHRLAEVFVVVDYLSQKGLAWRHHHGIKVTSLFTLADFQLALGTNAAPPPQRFVLRWRVDVAGAFPFHVVPKSAPLIVGDCVHFGTDAATYHAVDLASGRQRWSFKTTGVHRKGIWSSAAHHENKLFFGAYNGDFYCLDVASGTEIWRSPLCEWIGSSPLVVPRHDIVIVGLEYERPNAQGSMAALSIRTGEKVWEHPLRVYQHGSAAYFASQDLAICGTNDHSILALRAASGEVAWEFPTPNALSNVPPWSTRSVGW